MSFPQPVAGIVADVGRANVYSIADTPPPFPLPGDLWADTSYATPPGPQVKQWIGGGWQLYRGQSFTARTLWGIGGTVATIGGSSTQTVKCSSGPMGVISPDLGIEIAFGGAITMPSTAQTPGAVPITFDVVLGVFTTLPDGTIIETTTILTRTGMSVGVYGNNPGQVMTGIFSGNIWLPRRDSIQAIVTNDIVGMGRVGAAALTGTTSVALIGTPTDGNLIDGYYSNGSAAYSGVSYADVGIKMNTPALSGMTAKLSSVVVHTINEG